MRVLLRSTRPRFASLFYLLVLHIFLNHLKTGVSGWGFHFDHRNVAKRQLWSTPSTDTAIHSDPFTTTATTETMLNGSNEPVFPTSYSNEQMRAALQTLLEGSSDPEQDSRHLLRHNDGSLSKLQQITATRILDYDLKLKSTPTSLLSALEEQAHDFARQHGPVLSLRTILQSAAPRMALAAEFKRASPSKGVLVDDTIDAADRAAQYADAGADVLSVLTEERHFRGTLSDLTNVRLRTNLGKGRAQRPAVLRKDFITSRYMLAEAAAAGADTALLIVAVLPQHLLKDLIDYAKSTLRMDCLVEVHDDKEVQVALRAGAKVIGVNNRNLHTFQLDLTRSEQVAQLLKQQKLSFEHYTIHHDKQQLPEYVLCALSGMSTADDVDRYRQVGLGMCLIGESLMRSTDLKATIQNFCLHPDDFRRRRQNDTSIADTAYTAGLQLVKICGITNPQDAVTACQAGVNLIGVIFAPNSKRLVTAQQAKEIVQTVRAFGERVDRIHYNVLNTSTEQTAISSLLSKSSVLTAPKCPAVVGVFQNQSPEFIRQMVTECGLDLIQLHGTEGMAPANTNVHGVPAIRVIDICRRTDSHSSNNDELVETIAQSITNDPVAILLDTSLPGTAGGGTGVAFDWSLVPRLQQLGVPVLVAGGLTPETVTDCVQAVRPFGVDVSSGVEVSPGQKDSEKIRTFLHSARRAATPAR